MNPVVSREEWVTARKELLVKEKALTRLRGCARGGERREMPCVKVEQDYVFDAPGGKVALADLFGGKSQLIVYHFHAWSGMGGGLPELLFAGRSFRRQRSTPGASRCGSGDGGFAGSSRGD